MTSDILKYHPLRVTLHWLSAIIIIWSLLTGFTVYLMSLPDAWEELISFINVSMTTLFIPVFVIRVVAALMLPVSPEPSLNRLNQKVAHAAHLLLYTVISVELITGVLMMKRDINVFDIVTLPAPLDDPSLTSLFTQIHVVTSLLLLLLVALHILAVIKHQFTGKNVLARMKY
ncbi:cytochrome b/b6 domain-containing protein [Pantoea sp. SORGH_AS_0659]|uniref:cytochrome b n=1 Tax=Pantoea sp. SORGH_AS_0659 TaxID=3062597 RepID=UPI00285AB972|nr:cytochrome b/b6 domain-containing protein [Pantoea sp. SORGH_AS_0659]MDR6352479.1 cytochrome b561 [Pantoea sp. SORGH_AS_0659]